MAKVKAAAKGHSSYTAVALTVETYHRKNKARSSYQNSRPGSRRQKKK